MIDGIGLKILLKDELMNCEDEDYVRTFSSIDVLWWSTFLMYLRLL